MSSFSERSVALRARVLTDTGDRHPARTLAFLNGGKGAPAEAIYIDGEGASQSAPLIAGEARVERYVGQITARNAEHGTSEQIPCFEGDILEDPTLPESCVVRFGWHNTDHSGDAILGFYLEPVAPTLMGSALRLTRELMEGGRARIVGAVTS